MIMPQIACAITPIGTSLALFFAIVSTIFDNLRTNFGGPFRFLIRRRMSLLRGRLKRSARAVQAQCNYLGV